MLEKYTKSALTFRDSKRASVCAVCLRALKLGFQKMELMLCTAEFQHSVLLLSRIQFR